MPTSVIDRLREERDEARDAAIALAEADNFDPASESFRELEARSASLDDQIEHLTGLMERRRSADALDGRLSRAATRAEDTRPEVPQSWGDTFVRSDVFANYAMRGSSSRLDVPPPEVRALPTGISDLIAAGFKGSPFRVDTTPPPQPTPLVDAMTTINVSSNAIEYVAWSKVAGGAAKVAEKAAKPSAEYAPAVTSSTLDMIAVYTQLTRQLMEDESAVASAINNELRREVLVAEEAEAAAALVAAALPAAPVVAGTDLMGAIRVGVATVQAAGYVANAVLLNPSDWAEMDLAIWAKAISGPQGPQSASGFWGLSPISAASQPAGTATVGDFRAGVQHYARSQVQLYVTDSHADTFLANVFTLLAERRTKTAVVRPAALCECTAGPALP